MAKKQKVVTGVEPLKKGRAKKGSGKKGKKY